MMEMKERRRIFVKIKINGRSIHDCKVMSSRNVAEGNVGGNG